MKSTFVKGFIMQKKKVNCEICLQMKCIAIGFRIGINSSAKKNLTKLMKAGRENSLIFYHH